MRLLGLFLSVCFLVEASPFTSGSAERIPCEDPKYAVLPSSEIQLKLPYNRDFEIDLYRYLKCETDSAGDSWVMTETQGHTSAKELEFLKIDTHSGYLKGTPRRNIHPNRLKVFIYQIKTDGSVTGQDFVFSLY